MSIPIGRPDAVVRVSGNDRAPCLYGTIKFYQMGRNVLVVADVSGLPKSDTDFFAMHIHTGMGHSSGLGHYDENGVQHPMHIGDLPPLLSCGGKAFCSVMTNRFRVTEIIGKAVIIQALPDDFHSQPAGNAGERIACGTISQR